MEDPFAQFKATYITECLELLADMEEKLMGLDESADNETLNAIFRCAHSIKGGAGAFGLDNVAGFTHVLEALLDNMREGKITPTPESVDCLLRARDIVLQMILAVQSETALPNGYGDDVLAELMAFTPGVTVKKSSSSNTSSVSASAASSNIYRIQFSPHPAMIANGNEPLLLLRELSTLGDAQIIADLDKIPNIDQLEYDRCYINWSIEIKTDKPQSAISEVFEFVDTECDLTIELIAQDVSQPAQPLNTPAQIISDSETKKAPASSSAAASPANAPQSTSIRVDVDKVDKLINMVGEVVIAQSYLASQIQQISGTTNVDLIRSVEDMSHHIRDLQEAVMAVRMQPVKSIFARMPRLVRDLANQLGKDIHLEMVGENTEVDKTIIEQLSDPLTHMIRNSVDHGIESPQVRLEREKPAQGTIVLSAAHRGGKIVIQITDDGGGINREKVLEKAKEKGLIAKDANLNDNEIDMLIFAPGFSTADAVTNVSGRGVGMDVVKRNIEAIGGVVTVQNTPGSGSVFTIMLPLTLAILDGMIVRCGKEHYIVPIGSIIETLRPKKEDVKDVAGSGAVINVRGEFIPVLYLHRIFSIKHAERDASKGLVVLVENAGNTLGLMVDELIGQQQVVIKSLEENSDPVAGISGATILGDGKVSLILDIGQLHQLSKTLGTQCANDNEAQNFKDVAQGEK